MSMHGLGDWENDYPPNPTTATKPSLSSSFDWNSIINSSFKLASQFGMKPGQYSQSASGVVAYSVPGAVPGQYPSTAAVNVGGVSSTVLLLGGAALLAVIMFSGRR